MKVQIWSEGFKRNGLKCRAFKVGTIHARNFTEACIKFSRSVQAKYYGDFDSKNLTIYGCRLFDNELEARRLHG